MANPTNTRTPTSHLAPFGVRLQPELKARLEAAAAKAGRSLNAEIIARLERTLDDDDHPERRLIVVEELENLLHGVLDRIDLAKQADRSA